MVGMAVGMVVGMAVGMVVGIAVGIVVGIVVGMAVRTREYCKSLPGQRWVNLFVGRQCRVPYCAFGREFRI